MMINKVKVNVEKEQKIQIVIKGIEEGLKNLKERTDFESLRHKERVSEIETALNLYRKTNNPDALEHMVDIFKKTGVAMLEGEDSIDSTIWNASVQVNGEMIFLEHLFWELRDLVNNS